MTSRPGYWASIVALNVVLASGMALLAPADVGTTADRVGYEYVGQHPFGAGCPHNIFCYRVLVPSVVERVPLPPTIRWRAFAVAANAATGAIVASAVAGGAAPLLASILFQTSFAATFAVFDPFTPDPAVFVAAALLTLAWLRDRPLAALLIALVGVFAKETLALVISAAALAAGVRRRAGTRLWLIAAAATWVVVLGFHATMNRFAGWSESGSGSADLAGGAWLARWLADSTLTSSARVFYVFVPFGFAWLYALLGVRGAPPRLQALALGALIFLPGLVYVQTAERALGTAFFVVVPLAALFLTRVPLALALAAAVTNGLLTMRVGLSTPLLPPTPYLLALAAIVAAVTVIRTRSGSASSSVTVSGSPRVISSR